VPRQRRTFPHADVAKRQDGSYGPRYGGKVVDTFATCLFLPYVAERVGPITEKLIAKAVDLIGHRFSARQ
jgi:hypothetical protein